MENNEKQTILNALYAWIHQRPGLDYGNYCEPKSYRAELRSIQKDLHDARLLLRSVELSSITADELKEAFRAYSGRMTWDGKKLDYCTGQYWPTEYRRVVCAIAASALWEHKRWKCMPAPDRIEHKPEDGYVPETYHGLRARDWLRMQFRKEYGKGIQERWFN